MASLVYKKCGCNRLHIVGSTIIMQIIKSGEFAPSPEKHQQIFQITKTLHLQLQEASRNSKVLQSIRNVDAIDCMLLNLPSSCRLLNQVSSLSLSLYTNTHTHTHTHTHIQRERERERESISYKRLFYFDQGNEIFRYQLITMYLFGIMAIYIFLNINIYLYYLCKYEFINFYVYQHKT